mgnify:CR=1 FL=1
MSNININNIDLEKLAPKLDKYENQWVVISSENSIVGNGKTYREALDHASRKDNVVLFKVPRLDVFLAP